MIYSFILERSEPYGIWHSGGGLGALCSLFPPGDEGGTRFLRCDHAIRCARIDRAVYWKPAIRWKIDRIQVCNPIRFTNIRRNEVASKISASSVRSAINNGDMPYLNTSAEIQQRASMVLYDVRYVIDAHFELTDKVGPTDTKEKHYAIACRRLREGQCYHQPCFGCREFPAHFRLFEGEFVATYYQNEPEKDLGFMLYDMDYSDPENIYPTFFRAVMKNGVIDVGACEVIR